MYKNLHQLFVLVLTVSSSFSSYYQCPRRCLCWDRLVHCSSRKITNFPNQLPPGTSVLFIQNNSIANLNVLPNLNMSLLDTLILHHNEINHLMPRTFSSVSQLRYLDLSHNNLRSIYRSSFATLRKLTLLDLAYNKITTLAPRSFSDLRSLSDLFLSGNQISTLRLGLFSSLGNLKSLRLNNNLIRSLRRGIFSALSSLTHLDLSSNRIQFLGAGWTRGLTELQYLHLEDNRISVLDPTLSQPQAQCYELLMNSNLYNNRPLMARTFSNLRNIRSINLSNNSLSTIDYRSFSSLRQLETLKLNGNCWKCDCFLKWALTRITDEHRKTHFDFGEFYCKVPEELRGLSIDDLTMEDLIPEEHYIRNTGVSNQNVNEINISPTALRVNHANQSRNPSRIPSQTANKTEFEPFLTSTAQAFTTDDVRRLAPNLRLPTNRFPVYATITTTAFVITATEPKENESSKSTQKNRYSDEKILIERTSRPFMENNDKSTFWKSTTLTTLSQSKDVHERESTMIVLLGTTVLISILITVLCCFVFIKTKQYRYRCCFVSKEDYHQSSGETNRSYTNYPLVYDNPLARRPLPSQPDHVCRRFETSRGKTKHAAGDLNLRWTCGGTFGLGRSAHFNVLDAIRNDKDFTIEDPRSFHSAISYNSQDQKQTHCQKNRVSISRVFDEDNITSQSGNRRRVPIANQQSHYLVPIKRQNQAYTDKKAIPFESTSTNFDIVPTSLREECKRSLLLSNVENPTKLHSVKNVYRDRIIQRTLEVLKELDAFDEAPNEQIHEAIHESWQKLTENFLQNQVPRLAASLKNKNDVKETRFQVKNMVQNEEFESDPVEVMKKAKNINCSYKEEYDFPAVLQEELSYLRRKDYMYNISQRNGIYRKVSLSKNLTSPTEPSSNLIRPKSECLYKNKIFTESRNKSNYHKLSSIPWQTSCTNLSTLKSEDQYLNFSDATTCANSKNYSVLELSSKLTENEFRSSSQTKDATNKKNISSRKSDDDICTKDSFDSLFVTVDKSNNDLSIISDDDNCQTPFQTHVESANDSKTTPRQSTSDEDLLQRRLKALKEEYRKSMPLFNELLKKSTLVTDKERLEIIENSRKLLGSGVSLYDSKKRFSHSYIEPCLLHTNVTITSKDAKTLRKIKNETNLRPISFPNICLPRTQKNFETPLKQFSLEKSCFKPEKIKKKTKETKFFDSDCSKENHSIDSFHDLQSRKISMSSCGTASVSSIEFERASTSRN